MGWMSHPQGRPQSLILLLSVNLNLLGCPGSQTIRSLAGESSASFYEVRVSHQRAGKKAHSLQVQYASWFNLQQSTSENVNVNILLKDVQIALTIDCIRLIQLANKAR